MKCLVIVVIPLKYEQCFHNAEVWGSHRDNTGLYFFFLAHFYTTLVLYSAFTLPGNSLCVLFSLGASQTAIVFFLLFFLNHHCTFVFAPLGPAFSFTLL